MATTKKFAVADLVEMGLPDEAPTGGAIISDTITGESRWATIRTLIFRLADQPQNEAWRLDYRTPATEMQECKPWDGKTVTATLVREVEKLVKVWEPAENDERSSKR